MEQCSGYCGCEKTPTSNSNRYVGRWIFPLCLCICMHVEIGQQIEAGAGRVIESVQDREVNEENDEKTDENEWKAVLR